VGKRRILNLVLVLALLTTLVSIGGCVPTGEEPAEGFSPTIIIIMILIFGVFYFLMIRPQRKKQKEHQEMTQELQRGAKIITAGGIFGVIESISEDSVVIKVESGTTIRMSRSSIAGKQQR